MSIKSEGECTITLTRLSVLENIEKNNNKTIDSWIDKYNRLQEILWEAREKHLKNNEKRDRRILGMRNDFADKENAIQKHLRNEYEQKFIQHKKDFRHNLDEKIKQVNDAILNKNIELTKEVKDISIYEFIKLKYFTKTK